jgi:hypothetical protein
VPELVARPPRLSNVDALFAGRDKQQTKHHKTVCREILDDFSRRRRTLAMHAICAVLSLLDAAGVQLAP